MKTPAIVLFLTAMGSTAGWAAPEDWGVQTWTGISTRYPIYQKDVVYGDEPFLIDDSRDGKQGYEARGLSIFRAAFGGGLRENQPVVFYVHGGGWTEGYRGLHSYMALSLTGEKGWVTVVIDYRLTADEVTKSGTSEKAAWYPDNIRDVAAAFRWVVDHIAGNGGDPGKIIDFGQSAGGHLALMLAVDPEYGDLRPFIRGVVAMSPPYELKTLDKIVFCPLINQTFPGGCYNNQSELDAASPSSKLAAGTDLPPVYALYCQGELPSLAGQCLDLVERLRSLGQPSYLDYLDGYNHVTEIACFTTATETPVVLVTDFIERTMAAAPADFDGDGTSEIAVFRSATGLWAARGNTRFYFGGAADDPVAGDYDGNGTAGAGVFRESSGLWALRGLTRAYFGGTADLPVPGDYDGDGTRDIGLFRESSGLWAVRGWTRAYFGQSGDRPVPGRYAGQAAEEIAVFRPATGLWAVRGVTRFYFGTENDLPLPGDRDWSGTWQAGIFRPSSGLWAVRGVTRLYFGGSGDTPLEADYAGHLLDAIGVFRPSSGLWAIKGVTRAYFGSPGDIPVTR